MTNAEKALQYFIIAVPEDKEQAEAYFGARKALNAAIRIERAAGESVSLLTNADLMERAEKAEARAEKANEIAHSLCSDLIEIANRFNFEIAKYCGHYTKDCVIINGFCQKRNMACRGFIPKQAKEL